MVFTHSLTEVFKEILFRNTFFVLFDGEKIKQINDLSKKKKKKP